MNTRGEEEERLAAVGRLGTTTHRDRGGRHEQAQEQRPAVAHEDPGGVDVVGQEADAYPDHDDGQNRSRISVEEESLVSEADGVQEEGGRGDGRDAGRQAVQPVGQVQGVGQEHHPHHGEQGRQVGREQHDVQERDAQHDQRYAGQRQHAAGQHHPGDLGRCGHGSHVVYDPDCADDDRSHHHADHLRRSGEHLPEVSEHPGDQDPGQQAQKHRSSAQRGGWVPSGRCARRGRPVGRSRRRSAGPAGWPWRSPGRLRHRRLGGERCPARRISLRVPAANVPVARSAPVDGEPRAEGVHVGPDRGYGRVVVPPPQRPHHQVGDLGHLGLGHPLGGGRRGADAHAAGHER